MSATRTPLVLSTFAVSLLSLGNPAAAEQSNAREVHFRIENLTHAITFRPFLVAAHRPDQIVFRTGESASAGVQLMAECGALDGLSDALGGTGADFVANPVNESNPFDIPLGLLFPAGTSDGDTAVPFAAGLPGSVEGTLLIHDRRNTRLSVTAMLLPTNDAFAGLDSVPLPRRGTWTYYLNAYDAGTEANNEVAADDNPLDCMPDEPGFPVDPLGNTGMGGSGDFDVEASDRVHVHRGNTGDTDPLGGFSDLDSRIHGWQNPVVKITVSVRPVRGRDGDW